MCIKILPSLYIIYIIVCIVEALTNTINYKAIKFMVTKFKRKSLPSKSKLGLEENSFNPLHDNW